MKTQTYCVAGAKSGVRLSLVVTLLGAAVAQLRGQTLSDQNSSFNYSTSSGATAWTVDSVNQLSAQAFYFRIGSSGSESSITTISGAPTVTQADSRHLDVLYANSTFSVDVLYILTGNTSGSGISGVNATVTVKNLSGSALDLHFFQYSDFLLGGSTLNQSGVFSQSGGRYNRYTQTVGTLSAVNTFSSPSYLPSHVEAALYNQTLASLTDGNPTTLSDVLSAGPGNVTGAIEWDAMLAAAGASGDTLGISELMSLRVPEPSTLSLAGLGMLLAFRRARRSR